MKWKGDDGWDMGHVTMGGRKEKVKAWGKLFSTIEKIIFDHVQNHFPPFANQTKENKKHFSKKMFSAYPSTLLVFENSNMLLLDFVLI